MEVDVNFEPEPYECYKLKIKPLEPLNISISECFDLKCLIFWNRFSVYLYESDGLSSEPIVHHFDKLIVKVDSVNNILLYLDVEKGLYFTILRREGNTEKLIQNIRFKKIFDGVCDFFIGGDRIYIYRRDENSNLMYIYNLTGMSKFKLFKKIVLSLPIEGKTYEMHIADMRAFSAPFIRSVLSVEMTDLDPEMPLTFFVSGDEIYTSALKSNGGSSILQLHTCTAEIVKIGYGTMSNSALYLALSTGSVTILRCDENSTTVNIEMIHLNCTLKKIIVGQDRFTYTDGWKVWQTAKRNGNFANEKQDSKLLKIFNAYDFRFNKNNEFYCINLNNVLYIFRGANSECFAPIVESDPDGFIALPKSIKGPKMMLEELENEAKKNEKVLNEIVKENSLITIFALKQKSQLLLDHLLVNVQVYHDMASVQVIENGFVLITNLQEYYDEDNLIYMLKYEIGKDFKSKFKEFLSLGAGNWFLSVQIKTECFIQTISLNMNDDAIKVAIPVRKNVIPTELSAKLISLLQNESDDSFLWCSFPSRNILMNGKYYFKNSEFNTLQTYKIFDKSYKTINEKISDITNKMNVSCSVKKIERNILTAFTYFIRLPDKFMDSLENFCEEFSRNSNEVTGKKIIAALKDGFLKTKKPVRLEILNEFVEIYVIDEGQMKRMKLTGKNNCVCWDIYCCVRNTLQSINIASAIQSVPYFDFMKIKNIKDSAEAILDGGNVDRSTILKLAEDIHRDFIGIMPIV